ncbi:MAG: carboxypeptidase regulatory-like domain-containing protein [Gammaproteobacteria bacterium]|nr:carboxypeptidase regulatory-like domain-containing protein [Gammaproteobacteria bacterium]
MSYKMFKGFFLVLIVLLLASCFGDGGSEPEPEPEDPSPSIHTVSGKVSGDVLEGVTMTLSGTSSSTTTTDASGNYSFTDLMNGSYNVSPSLTGYNFNPPDTNVTISDADVANVDFIASVITYDLSGTVSISGGGALSGVTVHLQGNSTATSTTDTFGNYSFTGLTNGSYTVIPDMAGYLFGPTNIDVSVSNNSSASNNFTASAMNWTLRSYGEYLSSVAWSGSQFVVAGAGVLMTSSDGANWETHTPGSSITKMIWDGTQFVAVGGSSIIRTSSDGLNWSSNATGATAALYSVAWSGSTYVAVGASSTVAGVGMILTIVRWRGMVIAISC